MINSVARLDDDLEKVHQIWWQHTVSSFEGK